MANKTKSPHKLTFKLDDGSLATSKWDASAITPKLARILYRQGYREFKGRGKAWRPLQELMEAGHA